MKQFEYLIDSFTPQEIVGGRFKYIMEERGIEGWELVTIIKSYITFTNNDVRGLDYYWKREIKKEEE